MTDRQQLAGTLHEALDRVAATVPEQSIRFRSGTETLSYAELVRSSRRGAARLSAAGVGTGGVVGIVAPNAPEFLQTIFAVSRLGAVACPLPLPMGLGDLADYTRRTGRIVAASAASHLVVSHRLRRLVAARLSVPGGPPCIDSDELFAPGIERTDGPVPPDATAILQFTSGSTASPKGVVLTHDNVLHCAASIMSAIELGPADSHASWLPLFHDMGLFGTLTGIFTGIPINLWSPAAFAKDPARWLRDFSATRSTISTMPNFAFDALVDAVPPDATRGLDLSAWRVSFNGAETIRATSLEAFAERFEPAGFRRETMTPGYGMAEATLVATLPPLGRGPVVDWVDRDDLTQVGNARQVPPGSAGARSIVGLGFAVPGMEIRIGGADPEAGCDSLASRAVGEIQLRGPAVTSGYLAGTTAGARPFTADGWLRTGDLGYLRHGELFFTGRAKEMISVRGINTYPSDVEFEVAGIEGVRRRRCVAFADLHDAGGERIVVVAETALTDEGDRAALTQAIRARVNRALGLSELTVLLAAPDSIPRTTSGKLRRLHAREALSPTGQEVGNRA